MKWQSKIKKNRGTNRWFVSSLAFFLFAIFFFLVGFQELFHDHAPDGEYHTDCPVFGFVTTTKAPGAFLSILLLIFLVFFAECFEPENKRRSKISYNIRDNRAPPPVSRAGVCFFKYG